MVSISRERRLSSPKAKRKVNTDRVSMLDSVEDEESVADNYGLGLMIYGPEGVGKSSLLGFAPNVFFLCGPQERGINILKKRGLVPSSVTIGRPVESFQDTLDSLDEFAESDHSYKWLAVDGLSEIQRLAYQACADANFGGDLNSKEGFLAFQQGPITTAQQYWPEFISRLDRIRAIGVNVALIGHSRIEKFNNPDGPDYDRYAPDLADPPKAQSIWKMTSRWADAVLFVKHNIEINKEGNSKFGKNKAKGGETRIIGTEYCATYTAKNRFGLEPEIGPYDSPKEMWNDLISQLDPQEEKPSKSTTKRKVVR